MRGLVALWLTLLTCSCSRPAPTSNPTIDITRWALPREGSGQPSPRSVHIGHDGKLYSLDTVGRIVITNPSNQVVEVVRWMPEVSVGRPEGLCLLRNGKLAVSDTHYHRVVIFNPDGSVHRMFGSKGHEPGQFIYPIAIDEDAEGFLYVAEYGSNDRVQKFTPEGEFVLQFSSFGTGPDQLQRPAGLRVKNGEVYIADALNHRIQIFSTDGTHLDTLPQNDPTFLYLPYDLAIDEDGLLWVAEYGNGRVSMLSRDGSTKEVMVDANGRDRLFRTPWGLDIRNELLVVADTGNRQVVRIRWQ